MSVTELPQFPGVDAALRAGIQITLDDLGKHEFLVRNFDEMNHFFERYDCQLIEHADNFFYLVNHGDIIPGKQLTQKCVQVGKVIAYLARQPDITRTLGVIEFDLVMQTLQTLMTKENLKGLFAPRNREVNVQITITAEVTKAIKTLASHNFIVKLKGSMQFRPTQAISRFVEVSMYDGNRASDIQQKLEQRGFTFNGDDVEGEDNGH